MTTKKLTLKVQTLRVLDTASLGSVVGGAKKKADDNGKAAFMEIWRQIAEQQSGSYR